MIFPFLHRRERNLTPNPTEPHPAIKHHELHHDTSEGGEFLDDAIHIEDLPVPPVEVNVAGASPEKGL